VGLGGGSRTYLGTQQQDEQAARRGSAPPAGPRRRRCRARASERVRLSVHVLLARAHPHRRQDPQQRARRQPVHTHAKHHHAQRKRNSSTGSSTSSRWEHKQHARILLVVELAGDQKVGEVHDGGVVAVEGVLAVDTAQGGLHLGLYPLHRIHRAREHGDGLRYLAQVVDRGDAFGQRDGADDPRRHAVRDLRVPADSQSHKVRTTNLILDGRDIYQSVEALDSDCMWSISPLKYWALIACGLSVR
jgi:hypothetical protein